ncbi:MAG: NAD(P)H-hydrate dehydratase [Pseudomonadota bacterium]
MTDLLTAAQMRAIEQAAIESGAVTGLELMERAGKGVVEAVIAWRPELANAPRRALVLCGPGNNGGDGFVVARLLIQRGWEVDVCLYGDAQKLPPDAAQNAERWRELGAVRLWDDASIAARLDSGIDDLVVDALFGTGLSRSMPDDTTRTGHAFSPSVFEGDRPRHVAIDLPSGICSDSGANLGGALPANLTVTFHSAKLGHVLSPMTALNGGPAWCGDLRVADLGLLRAGRHSAGQNVVQRTSPPSGRLSKRLPSQHKFNHGHALILSGAVGKGGAARLAARGALRVGAGVVSVGCPPAALIENAARLDAVMLRALAGASDLREALADPRISALCLGPGFGMGARCRDMVSVALSARAERSGSEPTLGVVLDADALTSFEEAPEALFRLTDERCVLTPHQGEFGRLFPDIIAKLQEPALRGPAYSKVDATREAAARARCTVLFKGADTVIADRSGCCVVNSAHYERAAPWLATAGSGDVLAGVITGLLARGCPPRQAAETAAWLHVECALKFGPGLIAEDLAEQLPTVFRDLSL